jgi:hypothetical protein
MCLCDEVRIEVRQDAHYEIGTLDRFLNLLGDGVSFHGQASGFLVPLRQGNQTATVPITEAK